MLLPGLYSFQDYMLDNHLYNIFCNSLFNIFFNFFWIDICNYCRKKHVYYFFGREETKILNNNKIWESAKFESELETVGPWICLKS